MKITTFEQINLLNDQIKNIFDLVASTHKFYSTLSSSIVGVAILLYSNDIHPTAHVNYLYYIIILLYGITIIWFRNLLVYLYDLNIKSDDYNNFIKNNHIISMYNLSFKLNVRRVNIVIPFLFGGILCVFLLRYSSYDSWVDILFVSLYPLLFFLGFIFKIDWRMLKSL